MYKAYKEKLNAAQEEESVETANSQSGQYRLSYFPVKGRAELTRLIFAQAGVPFTDHRFSLEQWSDIKSETPFGQAPVLEKDGQVYGQSMAMARYVAKEHGLAGCDPLEEGLVDSVVDAVSDITAAFIPVAEAMMAGDEEALNEAKKKVSEETIPKVFGNLIKFLEGNPCKSGFFVGEQVTWADLAVFDVCDKVMGFSGQPDLLDNFPALASHYQKVADLPNIKAWLDIRPDFDIHNLPRIKLTYFPGKGRAELTRLILAQAGMSYDDVRISGEDWPELKPITPWGSLPILEYDNLALGQSMSIARFVAKQNGLAGGDSLEQALVDSVVDATQELVSSFGAIRGEKDEDTKKELMDKFSEEDVPKVLSGLEKFLENNNNSGYFVGHNVTWADLFFFHVTDGLINLAKMPEVLRKYPKLTSLYSRVGELPNIKFWLKKRPQSDF